MTLCAMLAARAWWPDQIKFLYLPFSYIALAICLPIFFSYMLLMNGSSTVWLMSATASILLVVLLYDVANAVFVTTVSLLITAGWFALRYGGSEIQPSFFASIPIFYFAIAAIAFLNFSENQIAEEKLKAARALASNIAHEMRTPLLAIQLDSEAINSQLASLEANGVAQDQVPASVMDEGKYGNIKDAVKRIRRRVTNANKTIDAILLNLKQESISTADLKVIRMGPLLATAIDDFPFGKGQRELVQLEVDSDFTFMGSDILMMNVIFNLLKNALTAIGTNPEAAISVRAYAYNDATNALSITDSGAGIPNQLADSIFVPFATSGRHMEGTGVGLSFCKYVVEAFGGEIQWRSPVTGGSEFLVLLPRLEV